MVQIARAHRVRVQLDAAQVDDPGQPAASSTTISSAVRPEGNDSVVVRSQAGRSAGARF
jgi:hypothetical protein